MESGTRLGPYEIQDQLGAGGMGEVYRARDTSLDRDVAIKVLPEHFATDVERLARFEREAKLLAQLNHPNVATIYGFEQSGAVSFIAMELVEGENLAQRITETGPIELDEALGIARQVALGLEAAHGAGLIHRDLKPANVVVAPDGTAKILDFGLAKDSAASGSAATASPDLTQSPTVMAATGAGVIMGTAGYMSPEQAKGKPLDARTDIWSFGVLLFEMLTGRSAFAGEDVSETLAAILKEEPPWAELSAEVSPALRRALRRCLSKDPERRTHHIVDARLEIEDALDAGSVVEAGDGERGGGTWRLAAAGIAGMALGGALVGVWATTSSGGDGASATAPTHVELALPEGMQISTNSSKVRQVASPDGSQVVFRGRSSDDEPWQLYRRNLRDGSVAAIAGTEGGGTSFFSPDGEYLAFFARGQLWKVLLSGGTPEALADAPNPWGGDWGPNGEIVYVPDVAAGIWAVSDRGGIPRRLTRIRPAYAEHGGPHFSPSFLPDGEAVLFEIWSGGSADYYSAAILDLKSGEWRVLLERASNPQYALSGHLVFGRGSGVWAVPFDLETRAVGEPLVPVVSDVGNSGVTAHQFQVSDAGVLVYQGRGAEPTKELVSVDLSGAVTPLGTPPRDYYLARFSPDGRRIAVTIVEVDRSDIWMFDVDTKTLVRVTSSGSARLPSWTDEGRTLAFESNQRGVWESWRQSADGIGEAEFFAPVGSETYQAYWPQVSRDGRLVVASGGVGAPSEDGMPGGIVYASASDPTEYKVLVPRQEGVAMYGATPSPDGSLVAYVSRETGQAMVYVTAVPGPGARRPVTVGSAGNPSWSADGRKLFFTQGGSIHTVDVTDVEAMTFSRPRELISTRGFLDDNNYTTRDYDVAPDGQSFVLIRSVVAPTPPTHLKVILNWFEELNERVPTDGPE